MHERRTDTVTATVWEEPRHLRVRAVRALHAILLAKKPPLKYQLLNPNVNRPGLRTLLITDFTELVRMNVGIYENQIFSKGPLGGFYTGKQLHMTLKDPN